MTPLIQTNLIGSDQYLLVLKTTINSFNLFFLFENLLSQKWAKVYKIIIKEKKNQQNNNKNETEDPNI